MKMIFILVFTLIVFGCHDNKRSGHPEPSLIKVDTPSKKEQPNFMTVEEMEQKRARLLDSNYSYLDKMLKVILNNANQKKELPFFSGKIDTSVFNYKNMNASYEFGNLFSKDKKHLIVKRFINEYADYDVSLFSDIYLLKGNLFEKVAADTSSESVEEKFEDVNCDGFIDYVVNSYSHTGCCPRSADNVYLYNPLNGYFVADNFLNRESACPNKIVYETSYGYDIDIEVYKYKWVGIKKILLESFGPTFISWDANNRPKTYTKVIYPSKRKIILKNAPVEYKKLEIFDHFKIK
jgi:hypothetical protein